MSITDIALSPLSIVLLSALPLLVHCGSRPDLDARGAGGVDHGGTTTSGTMGGGGSTSGGSSPGAGGSSIDTGAGGSSMGDDAGPPTCPATCETPAGPVFSPPSEDETQRTLKGPWLICSAVGSVFPDLPSDAIGIEFEPLTLSGKVLVSGVLHYLVAGQNGPIRGPGFDYQVSYKAAMSPAGDAGIYMNRNSNVFRSALIDYSPCPKRLELGRGSAGNFVTLTAL